MKMHNDIPRGRGWSKEEQEEWEVSFRVSHALAALEDSGADMSLVKELFYALKREEDLHIQEAVRKNRH